MANWFEHLNRDKTLLKNFYDLKLVKPSSPNTSNNSSGDSGMGNEFMYASTSSSTCSSSLSLSINQNTNLNLNYLNLTTLNLNDSPFNLTSLNNVSIFENEEYFNYFHKLLQQFNNIELNFKLTNQALNKAPSPQQPLSPPTPTRHLIKPQSNLNNPSTPPVPQRRLSNTRVNLAQQPVKQIQNNISSKSTPLVVNNQSLNHSNNQSHHHGFNLKNISKRLNFKSWFSSSNSSSNLNSNTSIPSSASQTNFSNSSRLPIGFVKTLAPNTRLINNNSNNTSNSSKNKSSTLNSKHGTNVYKVGNSGVLGSGVGTLINHNHHQNISSNNTNSNSLMKHSLSEPSLNAILN